MVFRADLLQWPRCLRVSEEFSKATLNSAVTKQDEAKALLNTNSANAAEKLKTQSSGKFAPRGSKI